MQVSRPGQSYVEAPPPQALARFVACLWSMRIPVRTDTRMRILPNGCVDIVVYASDTSLGEGSAQIVAPPHRSFVVGSTLRSFFVRSSGSRHVVGASLLPAGVQALLGVPARVIGERIVLLEDIVGATAIAMEDRILSTTHDRALSGIGDALLRLRASREVPPVIARAVHSIRAAGGQRRIDALARETNLSARQLERAFLEHVGVSPKTYSRLVRFDRAARGINTRGPLPWSQFALVHGYSDQAHLVNEFTAFAGIPPAQFERELASAWPGPATSTDRVP
ncbi:MAG TPA: helix-turn-helix domain-containing protein [Gemmatimonadaceae bacterium]|nr:helix-turn-helix domain-containing protein [Gemmatimonadaceae bacterium]